MKKLASIKTRITIWYTALMLVMISVVLILIGTFTYRMSMFNIESGIRTKVDRTADRIIHHPEGSSYTFEWNRELRDISIYLDNGELVAGQDIYDLSRIEFHSGYLRKEMLGKDEYIVYDAFRPIRPGSDRGYWVRGAVLVSFSKVIGRSVFMIVLMIIPFILLFTVLGGYYITRKAFLPVNGIIETANGIRAQNDIKKRIQINPQAREDELYNLSVTLNMMLDKIEELMQKEKQFTSDASHELRTPISVILAQGEYLTEIADTDKERELAENIVAKANQISELVSHLMLLARIDSNRQKINTEKVDLGVIAEIAAESMENLAVSRGITIETSVDGDIIVNADESLLLSAVTNLVSNAVKYGKPNGKVKVTASKHDDKAEIAVVDNGIGIDENQLDKIWDRFYRIDDVRNDEYGSSGLGLAMVKSIIELHGGTVTVKSKKDAGTKFCITLKA